MPWAAPVITATLPVSLSIPTLSGRAAQIGPFILVSFVPVCLMPICLRSVRCLDAREEYLGIGLAYLLGVDVTLVRPEPAVGPSDNAEYSVCNHLG